MTNDDMKKLLVNVFLAGALIGGTATIIFYAVS